MSVTGLRRSYDTPGTHHGMPKEKSSKDVKNGHRNEVQVQIDNDTFQYGHEYVGLNPIFQVPSFISARIGCIFHSNNQNTLVIKYSLYFMF